MGDVLDWIADAYDWFQGILDSLIVVGFAVTFIAFGAFAVIQIVARIRDSGFLR